jgi:hypothetical protein
MKTKLFSKEDIKRQLAEYIEFEILEQYHGQMGRDKQSKYCTSKTKEIFLILSKILGSRDKAMTAINGFSEKYYDCIEAKVLKL